MPVWKVQDDDEIVEMTEEKLRKQLRKGDLTGVELVGPVPSATLDAELAAARLLVAPSLGGESFGMVLIRAFASGTPVVASDIDGYRAVVDPGAGVLVPPGQPEPLAAAILGLLTGELRRRALAAEARRIAVAGYAWPRVARMLLEIYESLHPTGRQGVPTSAAPRPVVGTGIEHRVSR